MAVDRSGDEGIEKQRAADAPPPPPPPDRPGAEGFPSRAESRAIAAAAFRDTRPEPSNKAPDDEPDTSSARPADEDHSRRAEVGTPDHQGEQSADRQEPHDDGSEATRSETDDTDEPLSSERNIRGDDAILGEDPGPSDTRVPIEAADRHDARQEDGGDSAGRPADAPGEALEEQPPDGRPASDVQSPPVDEDADSVIDIAQAPVSPDPDTPDQVSGRRYDADPPAQPPDGTHGPYPREEQPVEDVLPVADTADESAADLDAITNSRDEIATDAESTGEPSGTGAESKGEGGTHGGEAPGDEDHWDFEFTLNNKLVRARSGLDTVRAEDWSNEVGDQIPDPGDRAGDRIVNETDDKVSRRERMRREGYRAAGDVRDGIHKTADTSKGLKRPPTSHPETRECTPDPGHEVRAGDHQGLDVGNAITAGLAGAVLIVEGLRFVRERLGAKRGRRSWG